MKRRSTGRWLPLYVALLAVVVVTAGCARRPPAEIGTTFPPAAPTRSADPDTAITGLIEALGPDAPMRIQSNSRLFVEDSLINVTLDGDFQGNEMDAKMSVRSGAVQLTFFVISADGTAYVQPYGHKWEKSPEKVPSAESGPFGDMLAADMSFEGKSKSKAGLFSIVWNDPTHAARALNGTVLSDVKIDASQMTFDVTSTGDPHSATYVLTGKAKYGSKRYPITVNGFYQFFRIHEPLEFEAPID